MLEAVRDDPCMVHAGFLVEGFCRVVLAYDDGEVAGGVKKNLISAYSDD